MEESDAYFSLYQTIEILLQFRIKYLGKEHLTEIGQNQKKATRTLGFLRSFKIF